MAEQNPLNGHIIPWLTVAIVAVGALWGASTLVATQKEKLEEEKPVEIVEVIEEKIAEEEPDFVYTEPVYTAPPQPQVVEEVTTTTTTTTTIPEAKPLNPAPDVPIENEEPVDEKSPVEEEPVVEDGDTTPNKTDDTPPLETDVNQ